jgi:DNA-binding NtrC family response regulator
VILIVDDDPLLLNLLDIVFQRKGFVVRLASHGQEAVSLYEQEHASIDVVLLDVCMPGLDGPETLQEMERIHPGVAACFMSGFTGQYTPEDLLKRGGRQLFAKPFRIEEITQALWQLACGLSRQSA